MVDKNYFNILLIHPFINLLVAYYKAFSLIAIPGALGWAIIAMTATIRGVLQPLMGRQLESTQKLQSLKPHLDELNKKHGHDKQLLQQKQLELYKQHGINPASGCFLLLLQFPVLIALYQVFFQLLGNGNLNETVDAINKIVYVPWLRIEQLDSWFFGFNLASKPSQWKEFGWWLLAIPVITAALQWYQTKMMMPQTTQPQEKKDAKEKKSTEDMTAGMQKQMAIMMPLMIGFFSYSFPIGLALYWNTFTLFSIISQRKKHDKK